MKRFYCTICQRVKRVRKYPTIIKNTNSVDVRIREGQCNRHTFQSQYTYRRKVAAR